MRVRAALQRLSEDHFIISPLNLPLVCDISYDSGCKRVGCVKRRQMRAWNFIGTSRLGATLPAFSVDVS